MYNGLMGKIKHLDNKTFIVFTEMLFFYFYFSYLFFILFYTGNFLDIHGIKDAFMKAVSHWYRDAQDRTHAGPFFFYLPIIALYELPIFVFGLLGMAHYGCCEKKKEKILAAFLVYWSIVVLMYYLKDIYPGSGRFLPISYVPIQ